jgi:branched-chain amino acid transport system permease protein
MHRIVLGVPLLVLACVLPLVLDDYSIYIVNLILVYAIAGLGLNILLGYAGQFAFAQGAFMGIGAYATTILMNRVGLSFWFAAPLGAVITTAVGIACALPALRMRHVYLALVTLAFAELVEWVLIHWKSMTSGTDGMSVHAPHFFGVSLKGGWQFYCLALACLVVMYAFARRILESKFGRAFLAVRENEILAQCNGIRIGPTKALAFAISAFYAGIAGALYAVVTGYIAPSSFNLDLLEMLFSIVVIGGLLSLPGPIIGSVIVTILPEVLRGVQSVQEVVYGVLLTVCIVAMPGGIAGLLRDRGVFPREVLTRHWAAFRRVIEADRTTALPSRPGLDR